MPKRLLSFLLAGTALIPPTAVSAADYPWAEGYVPNAGFALVGDGKTPYPWTYPGYSGYRNWGEKNQVYGFEYDYFNLITDWQAPASRRLELRITTPTPIAYTCVTGPEDPGSPNGPPWGAQMYVTSVGNAQLLCFNAARDRGYMVYTNSPCATLARTGPPVDPEFAAAGVPGWHYVIDGRACRANVWVRTGQRMDLITVDGRRKSPGKVFDFPFYMEADGP